MKILAAPPKFKYSILLQITEKLIKYTDKAILTPTSTLEILVCLRLVETQGKGSK